MVAKYSLRGVWILLKLLVKLRKSIMLFVKLMIITSVTSSFIHTWSSNYVESLFTDKGNYLVIFSFVLIFVTFSSLYGAFNIGIYRIHEIFYSFSLAVVFTNVIMYLELSLIARKLVEIKPLLLGVIFQILIISVISICANIIYFKYSYLFNMIYNISINHFLFCVYKKMHKLKTCAFNF